MVVMGPSFSGTYFEEVLTIIYLEDGIVKMYDSYFHDDDRRIYTHDPIVKLVELGNNVLGLDTNNKLWVLYEYQQDSISVVRNHLISGDLSIVDLIRTHKGCCPDTIFVLTASREVYRVKVDTKGRISWSVKLVTVLPESLSVSDDEIPYFIEARAHAPSVSLIEGVLTVNYGDNTYTLPNVAKYYWTDGSFGSYDLHICAITNDGALWQSTDSDLDNLDGGFQKIPLDNVVDLIQMSFHGHEVICQDLDGCVWQINNNEATRLPINIPVDRPTVTKSARKL